MNLHDHDIIYEARQEKAVETAIMLVNEYHEKPEVAAKKADAPLELVIEALKNKQENQK